MPLPDRSTPWPPPRQAARLERLREYDAWYAGDPERLSQVMAGRRDATSTPRNRPSQMRGGVVGAVSRFFWGQPIPPGEKRSKTHVPLPADIATASADLLFAAPPTIRFAKAENTKRWEQLDDAMRLRSRLHEAAEIASPYSGVYLRVDWDQDVAAYPLPIAVHADHADPTWRSGKLQAVTFWEDLTVDGATHWRYLQRHEMQHDDAGHPTTAITFNGLYKGTADSLGEPQALEAHEHTRGLEPAVDIGLPMLPVVWIPNMLPSREDRTAPGRSDFESVTPLFDNLDEVYTSLLRDIRLAKARIIVPSAYLTSLGPGRGAEFDVEREAYEQLNVPPTNDKVGITLQQFSIRIDEHEKAMLRITRTAVSTAGYSASTFGLDESGGQMTATEVDDRRDRTLLTRAKKTAYWGEGIRELAAIILAVDRLVFGRTEVDPADPASVDWPPGESPDQLKLAQTVQAWDVARAASTEVKVRAIHPDWDDTRVNAEVARIRDEEGATTADPEQMLRNTAAIGRTSNPPEVKDDEPADE